jgi:mannose-6-phosphate isomerase-like protein (cupin superfamily)
MTPATAATALEQRGWSAADMASRIVRYADLIPCFNAFIDTRSPGSEAKENFTIIGPGVSENPDQHVHITEAHGFNIGGARQPPGCVNSQHSHDTAEVFIVHSGRWRFDIGEHGADAQVELGEGDVISLPVGMFRGFTNVGEESGFLFAVLGKDDPGKVLWAPYVFDMAKDYGLVLLESGELIDTAAGQTVPDGARVMPKTSPEQIARLKTPTAAEIEDCVWRAEAGSGTYATALIGEAGPLDWDHGFDVDRIDIAAGEMLELLAPSAPEVLFVHSGDLIVAWPEADVTLYPGDTMTVPLGLNRSLSSTKGCIAFLVGR